MIAALFAMIAASQQNHFIAPCSLPEGANFFATLHVVPPLILDDFLANAGRVANPGEPVNLNDVGPRHLPSAVWRHILQINDTWFISYTQGGIAIRDITVAYELNPRLAAPLSIRYVGAVQGEVCTAIDYLRGNKGFFVLEGCAVVPPTRKLGIKQGRTDRLRQLSTTVCNNLTCRTAITAASLASPPARSPDVWHSPSPSRSRSRCGGGRRLAYPLPSSRERAG